jgi:excisionase family DNA binding protein
MGIKERRSATRGMEVTDDQSPKYIGETEKNIARLQKGELDEWITTTEAAQLSGYSAVHIRRLIRSGEVDANRWGRDWQVSSGSLLNYLEKIEAKGEKRGPKTKN